MGQATESLPPSTGHELSFRPAEATHHHRQAIPLSSLRLTNGHVGCFQEVVWDNFHQCHFDDDDNHQYHERDGFDGGADESRRGKGPSVLVLCVKKDGWTTLNEKNRGWL